MMLQITMNDAKTEFNNKTLLISGAVLRWRCGNFQTRLFGKWLPDVEY